MPHTRKKPMIFPPGMAFAFCMALTVGASFFAYTSGLTENRLRFDRAISTFNETLSARMAIYTNALQYTRNLFSVRPNLSEKEFRDFVRAMGLRENYPGIQTLGYVVRVGSQEAKKIARENGLTPEQAGIDEISSEFDIVKYFEMILETDARIKGVNLSSSAARRVAMDQARDMGQPVVSDRVLPLNGASTTYAFLVFVPRYREGAPIETVEQRRAALIGFVYGGFRANSLFGRVTAGLPLRNSNFLVEVFDGRSFKEKDLIYTEGMRADVEENLSREFPFNFANHTWSIRIVAPKGFSIPVLSWAPWVILALGSLLSIGIGLALWRARDFAERLQRDIEAQERAEFLLKEARDEADEANRTKSIFLANISHEIRTPLGVMVGFAEVALTQAEKTDRDRSLQTIVRNGKELTRIIGDVLDISRIEAESLKIETAVFSLRQALSDMETTWRSRIEAKGITFRVEVHEGVPDRVESDETRIKQVITNLLSNSAKFTSSGQIALSVEMTNGEGGMKKLSFTVRDTGIGIPEAHRAKLFRPFSQGDSSITRKFGGSGLGLALSKEIARAMGGELVMKDVQIGSEFHFSVPCREVEIVAQAETAKPSTLPSLQGKKILVVDDSEDNRRLVEYLLGKAGAEVDLAVDGEDGVMKALAGTYGLVLMDIQMPKKDGYSALRELQKSNYPTPVVALTAHALSEERDRALSAGFVAYLTKPLDPRTLVSLSHELTKS